MQGSITQSYFLWDAVQHRDSREIFYELENREEEQIETNQSELEEVYEHMQFKQKTEYDRMKKEKERESIHHH